MTAQDFEKIENIQDRQRAFLKDTVDFYSVNPVERRAIKKSIGDRVFSVSCIYRPINNSPGCAIGRFLGDHYNSDMEDRGVEDIYNFLPEWMQEMKMEFLFDVQNLHDGCENWEDNGLSERGKKEVEEFYLKIDSQKYDG